MAKSFLVIACVCYCTICMHLAVTVLATTKMENEHSKLDVNNDNVMSAINTKHRQPNDPVWDDNSPAIMHLRDRHKRQSSTHQKHKLEESSRFKDDDNLMGARNKRHADHHHNDDAIELNPNARMFVQKLFKQYGNGEQETMNFTGFEQMLRQLGLYRLIEVEDFSHKKSEPKSSGESGITDAKHAMHTNETVNLKQQQPHLETFT